jgi:hypothetical protein
VLRAFPNPALRPLFHVLIRDELHTVNVHYDYSGQEARTAMIWKEFTARC